MKVKSVYKVMLLLVLVSPTLLEITGAEGKAQEKDVADDFDFDEYGDEEGEEDTDQGQSGQGNLEELEIDLDSIGMDVGFNPQEYEEAIREIDEILKTRIHPSQRKKLNREQSEMRSLLITHSHTIGRLQDLLKEAAKLQEQAVEQEAEQQKQQSENSAGEDINVRPVETKDDTDL